MTEFHDINGLESKQALMLNEELSDEITKDEKLIEAIKNKIKDIEAEYEELSKEIKKLENEIKQLKRKLDLPEDEPEDELEVKHHELPKFDELKKDPKKHSLFDELDDEEDEKPEPKKKDEPIRPHRKFSFFDDEEDDEPKLRKEQTKSSFIDDKKPEKVDDILKKLHDILKRDSLMDLGQ